MLLAVVVGLVATSCGDGESTGTTEPEVATTPGAATSTTRDGPVAAADAHIEIGYTGEGTSYEGDRQIIEGVATFTFTNDSDGRAAVGFFWYEPGSTSLVVEMESLEAGERAVLEGPPAEPYVEIELDEPLRQEASDGLVEPGSYTWTQRLEPGTYIFDVGNEDFHVTGLWRAAVLEVVSADSS